ncbi:MAG TPA: Gfo/Idh/MocA family oxidoreductase, partial [Microbacterium sp.]|nr:Gfo/Idh/MocA family oxidoreductase [Microbacterium sp.]
MTTVLLVGAHGYGHVHLRNLERLGDRVDLIGLADPKGGPEEGFGSATPCWPTLDEALATGIHPDIVIVATPTNTHFGLAAQALEHGSHVYLEKPPVATMEQFTDLLALQERTGLRIQVGFQSFGSHALTELADLGGATSVATWANWSREYAYWNRSAWAGKRTLNGQPVVDGVLTNALSHAVATALHIAGARRREDIARIELELYRANDIEADDTSSVRITLTDGRVVSAALTLAGPVQDQPLIEVRTASADVLFSYTDDVITYPDGRVSRPGRIELFEQFLDHLEHGAPQLSALVDTGAYMEVLEAVRTAPAPAKIPDAAVTALDTMVVVDDIATWVQRTARAGALFSEVRAPFAPETADGDTDEIALGDTV